jgi:hypothetical protein
MFDAEPTAPPAEIDQLLLDLELHLAGREPVPPKRLAGDVFESPMLGRLEFAPMPYGRPSFWRGEQTMPDSDFPLCIVCEVEGDRSPGADHAACVIAFRRLQVHDANLCAPLINARLSRQQIPGTIAPDDLVLTLIHLPPHPLTDARFELGFRAISHPHLVFTVVFVRGKPRSMRVDSDA